jgi:ABC-type glycerol-3-phosphate transport system substrate-binding protein
MKDVVSPTAMEYAKSQPGGKYYGIPMVTMDMPAGRGVVIRYDILQAYNGGKYPTSVQGYVDFLKWVKATYPNSIPYAGRTSGDRLFVNSAPFFLMHGVYPYGARVQDGKYIRNLYLPEYRATVEVMRDLYASGVLDKDFVKCEAPQYFPKWQNTMVIWENGVDQILPPADSIRTSANDPNAVQMFIPPLTNYPSALRDVKYTYWTANSPITGHRVAIASSSKMQDKAWKVLEGFASPELRLAYEYGREGKEWNWSGGVRVPTDRIYSRDDNDADSHYWSLHLGIIQGFWPMNAKYAI